MLNNQVTFEFIHKKEKKKKRKKPNKQRFASYDVICMSYITMFILTKQICLSFDPIYLKSSINI